MNFYEKILKISPEFSGITERKEIAENNLKNKSNVPQVSKIEVQKLELSLVQSLKSSVIFYFQVDNKLDVLKRLGQMKRYAEIHQK